MPLLHDRDAAPEPALVFRNSQQKHGVTQKAHIDVNAYALAEQTVLRDDEEL